MKLLLKNQFKKLNTRGFSHHFLLPVIVVLAIAGIGVKVVLSKAYTVKVPTQYISAPATENGCWLSGRKWDSTKKDCLMADVGTNHSCRVNNSELKSMKDTDGTTRYYCTGAVNLEATISQEQCVNQLHRMFVKFVGCARVITQDNTNGARQCIGNNVPDSDPLSKYKNYVADGTTDRCVAPTIAPTPPPSSGVPEDAIAQPLCSQLGRKLGSTAGKCQQVCQSNAGTLLVGSDAAKTKYCSGAIGSGITQTRCTQLHRVWVSVGCTRRPDQQDNANDLIHCMAGYPYYNADSDASSAGKLDVCEKDKATSDSNENAGIIGGQVICRGGQILSPDRKSCSCAAGQTFQNGVCKAPGGDNGTPPSNPNSGNDPEAASASYRIILYKGKEFKGDKLEASARLNDDDAVTMTVKVNDKKLEGVTNLAKLPKNWNDKTQSFKILKGRWQLCEGVDYKNGCVKPYASDPNLTDGKNKFKISSLQPFLDIDETVSDIVPVCLDAGGNPIDRDANGNCPANSTLTCPDTDESGAKLELKGAECVAVTVSPDTIVPVDKDFKGKDGERKCKLLGREWIARGNGDEHGCSIETCRNNKDGRPKTVNTTGDSDDDQQKRTDTVCVSYEHDAPYAVKLDQKAKQSEKKCDQLHRVWIEQVKLCAQVPNRKDKNQTILKADQCTGKGDKVYYIFKETAKTDECFNPSYFQNAKSVAKSTGGALSAALQQGPKAYCKVVKGGKYHWDDGKCVIDRHKCWNGQSLPVGQKCPVKPQPSAPDTSTPDDGQTPPPGTNWGVFCGNLNRVAQSNGCGGCDSYHPVRVSVPYPGWDHCTTYPHCPIGTYDPSIGGCPGHGAPPSNPGYLSPHQKCTKAGGHYVRDDYCESLSERACHKYGGIWKSYTNQSLSPTVTVYWCDFS